LIILLMFTMTSTCIINYLRTHHVVWSLAGVSERHVLRDNSVEHHLHVVSDVGVPVLVDGEAGGGVQQLDVHQAHRKLGQLRQLGRRQAH
jgi:hypothetical protein